MADNQTSAQQPVEKRQIGQSDLWVSPVGLGCWPISGMTSLDVNEADSQKTLLAAIDAGINFFDTAYGYGIDGNSERMVGEAVRERRDEIVIATKGGMHWNSSQRRQFDSRPERIRQECDASLQRLGVETIDLHYLHAHDGATPIAETAGAFLELQQAGKIRAAGVSNLDVSQTREFHDVCPIAAVQPPFNMLQQSIQNQLVPWCVDNRVSVIPYWPLMKGLLAGKIRRGHKFDPSDNRLTYDIFQGPAFENAQQLLDQLDVIAKEIGKTVAQVVVNWTFHQPGILSVLCGAKRDWQIVDTAGAIGWRLSQAHRETIDRLLSSLDVNG
jgi:aryl-alcohol dehydrogenase-like predicted oxidoreductase